MTSAYADPPPVTVRVPAKVNLELNVGPLRADGYHSLSTIYQAVAIYDDVTVAIADDWGVTVTGPLAAGVPTDDSNLAVRAAQLLSARVGNVEPVHLTIRKNIPVAGGMAGGSADAAAALVACDALWQTGVEREDLIELAAELGSDVPFLILGGTAMGSGRGERMASALARGTFHWVFALSDDGLSTPAVYAECDRLRARAGAVVPEPQPTPELMSALRAGDARALAATLSNDLQEAAISLRPALGEILAAGLDEGALGGVVSGSGPTVAFLVATPEAGIDLAVALTASGTAADVRRATGPTHGAHIIPARVD